MSIQNTNISNINISTSNVSGNCNLKCSYGFKYNQSSSTAKNNGVMISLTYDSSSVAPVLFNENKYQVENISITSPSIHTFDYNNMPGEIIIEHNPELGGNKLKVCIPFTASSESSTASQIISSIITTVSMSAPSEGDSTNLNMNFSLQDIVPRKPFYTYQDDKNIDWIVFGSNNAIPLSSSTITTLQQIIKPFPIPTPGKSLFYNAKGPISGIKVGDGLYISCQPTGSTKDEVAVQYESQPTSAIDVTNITQNPTFKTIISVIIGMLLFILVFYGINYFYSYLTSQPVKLENKPKVS
jgi:hypothetical protein